PTLGIGKTPTAGHAPATGVVTDLQERQAVALPPAQSSAAVSSASAAPAERPAASSGAKIEQVHWEYDVPTPGNRPALEKSDSLVGQEPGEQPPWTLTNLWTYDERRSWFEAGTNPLIDRGWKVSGNTVQSFVFNPLEPVDRFNGPTTWTDRSND